MPKKTKISPRKAPKQSRSRDLVGTIVTATARILTQVGYEHATTNKVAEKAGVSIGSLYQYFPSKESLIAAVIDNMLERNTRRLEARLATLADASLEESLRAIVETGYETYLGNRKLFRIMFEQAPRLERVQHIFRARRHLIDELSKLLEKYDLRPAKPELVVYVLFNGALGVIQSALFDFPEGVKDEELIDEIVRLCLSYLMTLTPSPKATKIAEFTKEF